MGAFNQIAVTYNARIAAVGIDPVVAIARIAQAVKKQRIRLRPDASIVGSNEGRAGLERPHIQEINNDGTYHCSCESFVYGKLTKEGWKPACKHLYAIVFTIQMEF